MNTSVFENKFENRRKAKAALNMKALRLIKGANPKNLQKTTKFIFLMTTLGHDLKIYLQKDARPRVTGVPSTLLAWLL